MAARRNDAKFLHMSESDTATTATLTDTCTESAPIANRRVERACNAENKYASTRRRAKSIESASGRKQSREMQSSDQAMRDEALELGDERENDDRSDDASEVDITSECPTPWASENVGDRWVKSIEQQVSAML